MPRLILHILTILAVFPVIAQPAPAVEWQRNLGGSSDESGVSIEQASDGGYIVCGTTFSNNGDVTGNHGNADIWVLKLNASGSTEWQRCLGGTQPDNGKRAFELSGGGYLVLGNVRSNDGDVSGNHGMIDFWLARLATDGTLLWQRCYGGSLNDAPSDMKATPDGGFIIAGESRSNDGDLTANAGSTDYWVLKLDSNFDIQWQRSYGGSSGESAFALALTSDGGYILNGISSSNDGDVTGAFGAEDYWVVKLDALGNIQWQRPCGGSDTDLGSIITEHSDGSFLALGTSFSQNGDVSAPLGSADLWSIRLSALGQPFNERSYGGSNTDTGTAMSASADGAMVYSGTSRSADGDLSMNQGMADAWLFRIDNAGDILWSRILGGSQSDTFLAFNATDDGGYIAVGQSSSNDGDLPGNNGGGDVWVVKFGPDPVGIRAASRSARLDLYPNPCIDRLRVSSTCQPGVPTRWNIIDGQGRIASEGSLSGGAIVIDVSPLSSGAYSLVMQCADGMASAPFVKE